MPQPFPDPKINSTLDILEYANEVTNSWMAILFLMAGSVIIFLILKQQGYRTSDSLTVSFFSMFILGSMLWAGGLLAGKIIVLWMVFLAASAIYSAFDRQ